MKNIFNLLLLIFFTQISFAQKPNTKLVAKKNEINLSFEPKMRGIEVNNVTYYIEKDMQTISAYKNGKIKWQTNIIYVCGKPGVGKPEVRCLKIKGGILQVVFGKHSFANVNINNGKTKFIGSD